MKLKVNLENDSIDEFKEKFGSALDILNHVTETSYNEMTIDGFMDWACDLSWIYDEEIEIEIIGAISSLSKELLEDICEFWEKDAERVIAGGKRKKLSFIIKNN